MDGESPPNVAPETEAVVRTILEIWVSDRNLVSPSSPRIVKSETHARNILNAERTGRGCAWNGWEQAAQSQIAGYAPKLGWPSPPWTVPEKQELFLWHLKLGK